MAQKRVIKDLRSECHCENEGYCPLEALLNSVSDRLIEQHKLVEYWKYDILHEDLSWNDAYIKWMESGLARRFAEVYHEDKTYKQMRKEIFGK